MNKYHLTEKIPFTGLEIISEEPLDTMTGQIHITFLARQIYQINNS